MATSAERQRRYREHKKGNHSLCVPGNCPVATPETTDERPEGNRLGPAGSALWDDVMAEGDPGPMGRVLLLEAARIADRLDRLDDALQNGGEWLEVETGDSGRIEVVVDKALSEARQQAVALKGVIAEIRQVAARAKPSGGRTSQHKGAAGGIADLSARIAARRETTG